MNSKNLGSILLIAAITLLVFLGYSVANKWIKYQAIDNCLRSGKSTSTTQDDKGGKYTNEEPLQYWYETCMKEKGLMKK